MVDNLPAASEDLQCTHGDLLDTVLYRTESDIV